MEIEKPHNAFDHPVFSWETHEFIKHEKGLVWFLLAGLAALALIIYGALTDNWTLALALIIFAGVYVWQHSLTPDHVQIVVSKVGIKIGEKEYPYNNIDAFWIFYKQELKTLNIRSNSHFLPDVSIQLSDQEPSSLRYFLGEHVDEVQGKEETLTEALVRFLKI